MSPAPSQSGFGNNEILMVVGGGVGVIGLGLWIGAGGSASKSKQLRAGIQDGSSDDVAADFDKGNSLDKRALALSIVGGVLLGAGLGLVIGGAALREQASKQRLSLTPGGLEVRF